MSNTSTDQPTVVRMTAADPGLGLTAGQILPHEGTHEISGYPLATLPDGQLVEIDSRDCEVIEVVPTADLHVITERADGPDLDDLVRLIRYLRHQGLPVEIGYPALAENLAVAHRATWKGRDHHWLFTEGVPNKGAAFIGPDGTVYDCNGEAL